jgi:hypothetical protein
MAQGMNELDQAFERAVRCLLDLGYHKAIGQSKGAYAVGLPRPAWDPVLAAEGYDLLILVDPRAPQDVPMKHGNMTHHMSRARIEDVVLAGPRHPHWLQVQAGARYRGRAVRDALVAFAPDERGLTVLEGLALVLQHPNVLADDRGVDLPGSRAHGIGVPCIATWYGKVGLFARSEAIASPLYGAATLRTPAAGGTPGGGR